MMHASILFNRVDYQTAELAAIQYKPLATQWTEELRTNIQTHPRCRMLKELLNLDLYTRAVLYPFFIKGWTPRRIADRLKISLVLVQELLQTGREQLKRKLTSREPKPGLFLTKTEERQSKSLK
jgi:DNA-directed RNA polymerase specialized sigma24 family protein